MRKEEIILIGGGGHCKSVITAIESENKYLIAGIVDLKSKIGKKILGYPVIADDQEIPKLIKKYKNFCITIGQIKNSERKLTLFQQLKAMGVNLPNIVSPSSYISKHAKLGIGNIILHDCIINANAKIGDNNIINNKVLIEHDAVIGNNNHISTTAVVNGDCTIDNNCFIGSNSVLVNGIKITSNVVIGAGAVVVKNIDKSGIYVGNPAKLSVQN